LVGVENPLDLEVAVLAVGLAQDEGPPGGGQVPGLGEGEVVQPAVADHLQLGQLAVPRAEGEDRPWLDRGPGQLAGGGTGPRPGPRVCPPRRPCPQGGPSPPRPGAPGSAPCVCPAPTRHRRCPGPPAGCPPPSTPTSPAAPSGLSPGPPPSWRGEAWGQGP